MRSSALLASAALGAAGCGGGDGSPGASDRPRLVVSAAASMTEALRECSPRFAPARVRLSFAGSNELAAQIRAGGRPDLYAAADTAPPERLAAEGLLERPVRFATNELVVAVPARSRIDALRDLAREQVTLAIASKSVPVGDYARSALARLPGGLGRDILANVRTNEPDVRGIVGKVAQGAVDAGLTYRSDVRTARGRLRSLPLPPGAAPRVIYAAGVVSGAREPERARRYVRGLVAGRCADSLRSAGFGPPP